MADDVTFFDEIEAYVGRLSVAPGEPVPLHVSARTDRYDVVVERWGAERREVWRSDGLPGAFVAPPGDADSAGCRWPVSLEIPTDTFATSGFHLVTVRAHHAEPGRDVAHAGFVVRAGAAGRADTLLVLATNTWNAYNTWGGASLYTGGHRVSFRRPWPRGLLDRPAVDRDDRKARPTRYRETPDADGERFQQHRFAHGYTSAIGSTGWFTHERRFVEWAEAAGLVFDYAVSSDLHDPTIVDGYDVVVGVGHDEYWTAEARDTIDAHVRSGGSYVSLSGNTMFWQVRLEDDAGRPGIDHMVCHKYRAHLDDPVMGTADERRMAGLWCDPVVDRPEWSTLGAGSVFGLYHRFGQATPRGAGGFTIHRPDHWLVAGTGLRFGDVVGVDDGVVGYETVGAPVTFDEYHQPIVRPVPGMPTDVTVIGLAMAGNLGVGEYPKSIAALSDQGDAEFLAERYYGRVDDDSLRRVKQGTATMSVCRPFGESGGRVVTIGSTDWVFGLGRDPIVERITANALERQPLPPGRAAC